MRKYFRIGEISRLYHIGVDSLRYYEELGLIHPARGESGYRLYSIDDIWRLNVIRELRELGFSMERIRQYLDHHTVDTTLQLLQEEQVLLRRKLQELQKTQANVTRRMEILRQAQTRPLGHIAVERYDQRRFFSIHEGYSEEHEMDVLIKRLVNLDQEHFYVIGNNQIGTLVSRSVVERTGKLQYEAVFLMDEGGAGLLPGGTYLTVSYQGPYEQSAYWAQQLLAYAKENDWTPVGDILEVLWVDIHTTECVDERITELQLRVER